MHRCLTLAQKGRGNTGINPMVGAVLVRDEKIIAEGYHEGFGKAHAERMLLQNFDPTSSASGGLRGASQEIRSTDTLYVNLEPCCHTKKKTPPCTEFIVEKGIKNVVYGMKDPNPEVSGQGLAYLNKKSIQTFGPILEQECKRLNRGFISLMTKKRPWITLKSAVTHDRRFANPDGSPLKITTPEQDQWSHEFLRARHDAILVGVGTVIADDPQLTVRYSFPSPSRRGERSELRPGGGARGGGIMETGEGTGLPAGQAGEREPWRVILDPTLRIPLTARVIRKGTIVIASSPNLQKKKELEAQGVRVLDISMQETIFDWDKFWKILMTPIDDFYGISSILVEGGQKTWDVFRQAGIVDEEVSLVGKL